MPIELKISIKALRDIEEGMHWYESNQKGLGDRFEEYVNDSFLHIKDQPFAASFSHEDVRYKVVDKFPYVILYEVRFDVIYILRVFNTNRKPL